MTGAAILAALLERQGIDTVAGMPGGANLPLYDALGRSPIRHVLARHEQGAGFIAQGMARATGRAAVCLATSGPGATNLLTAIADARLDSIPLVAVTGQVATSLLGTDAFQEVDTYGLTVPITKHNFLVRRAGELLEVVPEAFALALSGRPGPVVLDVPKDVQQETTELSAWPEPGCAAPAPAPRREEVARLAAMIAGARRPVLLAGGGIVAAGASEALRALSRRATIPVALTLAGLGTVPADDPLCLGMVGMHGAPFTNRALDEADLLVAVGVRFDDRATGKVAEFCPRARIAHVDVDAAEIGKIKAAELGIAADAGATLRALLGEIEPAERAEWTARLRELRSRHPLRRSAAFGALEPLGLLERAAARLGPDVVVTTDVGQHQMWVAQVWPFARPRQLLTSGGLGTMGFGLPAAIGAALARPATRVVCVTGDGSLLINVQELATLAETGADVTVLLLDNGHLGLVRQQQELFYARRFHASRFEHEPDFAAIARGFGVPAVDLAGCGDPFEALDAALDMGGPSLVRVPIPPGANVLPMVPPGAANRDMIEEGETRHA